MPNLEPNYKPVYRAYKTYGHIEGLSCAFRQWRASHSHCQKLHGYALSFSFIFASHELDSNQWCYDFGGLKPIRAWLHSMFDHATLVAEDDPFLTTFEDLARNGLINLRVMPAVGCEAVASFVYDYVANFVTLETNGRAILEKAEVREHAGNAASYSRSNKMFEV